MANTMNSDQVVSRDAAAIPFHRHCQATVLSAYGPDGNGLTWNTINTLPLNNLPATWKTYFTGNYDNITQDLAGILKLIDKVAENAYTIQLHNSRNGAIGDPIAADVNHMYNLKIGRDITLQIHGSQVKFNTAVNLGDSLVTSLDTAWLTLRRFDSDISPQLEFVPPVGGGNVDIDITPPTKTLTVVKRGNTLGTMKVAVDPRITTTDKTIDVTRDENLVYALWDDILTVVPERMTHVYRRSAAASFVPTINLNNYNAVANDIVSFELHVKNNGGSAITVGATPTLTNTAGKTFTVVPLTDLMTVQPGKTNVYVYRIDMNSSVRKLTYSLAYIY